MPASYMSKRIAIILLVLLVAEYLFLLLAVIFAGRWPFNLIALILGCAIGVVVLILYAVHEYLYKKQSIDITNIETAPLLSA